MPDTVASDQVTHAAGANQTILDPALIQLYDSIGDPEVVYTLMPHPDSRRWMLLHHLLQTLPHGFRLPAARLLTRPSIGRQLFHAQVQQIIQFLSLIDTAVDRTLTVDRSLRYGLLHEYQVPMARQNGALSLVDATGIWDRCVLIAKVCSCCIATLRWNFGGSELQA